MEQERQELIERVTKILSIEQVKEILSKYQYEPRLEYLPDILYDKHIYKYDYGKGLYEVDKYLKIKGDLVNCLIFGNSALLYSQDKKNSYLYKLEDGKLSKIDSIETISDIYYYKDNYILCIVGGKVNVKVAKYDIKENKLQFLSIEGPDTYGIQFCQANYILTNADLSGEYKIYKIDIDNLQIIPVKIEYKNFVSLGKYHKLAVELEEEDPEELYFYDLDNSKISDIPINAPEYFDYDVMNIDKENVICEGRLYKIKDNNIISSNIRIDYSIDIVINTFLIVEKQTEDRETKCLRFNQDLSISNQRIVFEVPATSKKIFGIPVSKHRDLSYLIPNIVSPDIKNIILNFCRSDQLVNT